ncbi:MAG TPA: M20/M25/M40 family metallo-hydrolase [Dokdonella sp.]|uniref:M20/M25/M40 family metallo-hydrolase n=1 Tax=Dokdonella sp. TaxID=2291710 RepID=UPI002BAE24B7|nr:M20/M25/M40 family metallo-hydrolase [Dokdonella sp.]HUD40820.1 M20/M25/M40 family metallo-hydrolase [Dokdonella sp.]
MRAHDRNLPRLLALALFAAAPACHAHGGAAAADDRGTVYVLTSMQTYAGIQPVAPLGQVRYDSLGTPLMLLPVDEAQRARITAYVHEVERRCGGYFAFDSLEDAEAFLAGDKSLSAVTAPTGGRYTIDNAATVDPWLPQVDDLAIYRTIEHLSSYRNRYYASSYGRESAEWIRDTWAALGAGRADVSAELFTGCTNCSTQPSVILTVTGSERPDEVVVVGAHLDSINGSASGNLEQIAPGADDDASGIATITEIVRVALGSGWRPQRTVKFMGYAAEEVGLRGSNAIARRFATDGVDVVGVLQLDMTNYRSGDVTDFKIISDYSNADLRTFVGELFDAYLLPLGLTRSSYACNYGCSDHASWTSSGFPAVMVAEPGSPQASFFPRLHTTGDTLANMGDSAVNSAKFARFGLAFVGELAKTSAESGDRIFGDGFEPVSAR